MSVSDGDTKFLTLKKLHSLFYIFWVLETKFFLRLVNYFLIQNFAEIIEPIMKLLSPKIPFKWRKEQDLQFEKVCILLNKLTMFRIDYEKPFCIATDGSKLAVSTALMQKYKGQCCPVKIFSRKLQEKGMTY